MASSWCGQIDPPTPAPIAIGDCNAALYYREKTGRGQNIDISMTDCLFHLNENNGPGYLFSGRTVPAVPNTRWSAAYAPYGLFKGRDGLVVIAALSDVLWEKLVNVMGEDYKWLLTDPRTNDLAVRLTYQNAPFIHQIIEDRVTKFDSVQQVEDILRQAGIPAMRVRTFAEVVDAPYIRDREMLVKMNQPFVGEIEIYGSPLKCPRRPAE